MNFDDAVAFVLEREGGLSDLIGDSGGLTKFGISKNNHPKIDIANLTKEQAIEIYRTDYWQKLHCDELPSGLDLLVFDAAVNEGSVRAAQMLQAVLGGSAGRNRGAGNNQRRIKHPSRVHRLSSSPNV